MNKVKSSSNKQFIFAWLAHRHPLITINSQNCQQFSLKVSSNSVILLKFTHVLAATAKWPPSRYRPGAGLRRETSQQWQPEVILAVTSLPLAVPDVCRCRFLSSLMFLRCNSNNRAETVLNLFLDAINRDGNLWPSRIRVDKSVENVLVCDAMVQARGEGRGSFIAGPSTHNQRIERL